MGSQWVERKSEGEEGDGVETSCEERRRTIRVGVLRERCGSGLESLRKSEGSLADDAVVVADVGEGGKDLTGSKTSVEGEKVGQEAGHPRSTKWR